MVPYPATYCKVSRVSWLPKVGRIVGQNAKTQLYGVWRDVDYQASGTFLLHATM
jgi:hypothetical protein